MGRDKLDTDDGYMLEWDEAAYDYKKVPRRKDELVYGKDYGPKCECGVSSLGYEVGHSDYCPLYRSSKN